jgi:hypothetical protein
MQAISVDLVEVHQANEPGRKAKKFAVACTLSRENFRLQVGVCR